MNKEDFQKYYDSNRYPSEIFLEYYMETCEEEKRFPAEVFLEYFPLWSQGVNIRAILYNIVNHYVDRFKVKRRYEVQLLSKDNIVLKHLPPIYDRK